MPIKEWEVVGDKIKVTITTEDIRYYTMAQLVEMLANAESQRVACCSEITCIGEQIAALEAAQGG